MPATQRDGRGFDYSADLTPDEAALVHRYYPDLPRLLSKGSTLKYWASLYPSLDDAVQEASIGLLKAVRRFDPTYGTKPLTLIYQYLRAALQDGLKRGWSESLICAPIGYTGPIAMVAEPEGDNWLGLESLAVDQSPEPGEDLERADHSARLLKRLNRKCSPREIAILRAKFVDGLTLSAIAERLDISKERCRQIIKAAIGRANNLKGPKLDAFLKRHAATECRLCGVGLERPSKPGLCVRCKARQKKQRMAAAKAFAA